MNVYPTPYYGDMMRYVAGQLADGEVERREFNPGADSGGSWPIVPDEGMRAKLENFVLKNIPSAHKFMGQDGAQRIVYMDERGRAVDGRLSDVSDEDLIRIARRHGMRGIDAPDEGPRTSKTNHGYQKPRLESIEEGRQEDEDKYVAGLERKLRPEVEKHIGDAGKIVELTGYAPAKGGGWAVVLSTEYAALKLYYVYRRGNTHLEKRPNGWLVSSRDK